MTERIKKLMEKLDITYEEAVELLESDRQIDRMTKMSDINSDLTKEQIATIKKAKNVSRGASEKPNAKREKKVDETKKTIISTIIQSLTMAENVSVTNDEREFTFTVNGEKYKVVLSKPRK